MKSKTLFIGYFLLSILPGMLIAQIPVALMPSTDNNPKENSISAHLSQHLSRFNEISLLSKEQMGEILKLHSQAQKMGSDTLDIKKLKTAEFLIYSQYISNEVQWKIISVNQGNIVYSKTIKTSNLNDTIFRCVSQEMVDHIINQANLSGRQIPDAAKPFWEVIEKFVSNLSNNNEAIYPYVAFYSSGQFVHPHKENPSLLSKTNMFLRIVKKPLIKSKIVYLSMEQNDNFTYITLLIEKYRKNLNINFD